MIDRRDAEYRVKLKREIRRVGYPLCEQGRRVYSTEKLEEIHRGVVK